MPHSSISVSNRPSIALWSPGLWHHVIQESSSFVFGPCMMLTQNIPHIVLKQYMTAGSRPFPDLPPSKAAQKMEACWTEELH